MTHEILQSDILLAGKLISEQRPDEEILQALAYRSVDRAQAATLVNDLRNGRKPAAGPPLPAEMGVSRRSRSRRAPRDGGESSSASSPQSEPHHERKERSAGRRRPVLVWAVAAGVVVLAVAVVGIVIWRRAASAGDVPAAPKAKPGMVTQGRAGSISAATATAAARGSSTSALALELQPDGLHIGGRLVTGGNVLPALANSLGAPTRTNQAAQAGTMIYAYDHQGMLIYSQPGGRTNHIVLDCEATGGANGTTSPFAGTLQVEDQVIGPDTDSQTLAGMKKLGLGNSKSGGTVWGGHYHGLELVFAYLKSPQRLSLIEIDLN